MLKDTGGGKLKITRRSITIAAFGIFVMLAIAGVAQIAGHACARDSDTGKSPDVMVIAGLPGFQALAYGKNKLSITVVPASTEDNPLAIKVTGLAASSPGIATAVVYTLSEPMPGVLDLSQKTLRIDLSNFNTAASEPERIDTARVNQVLMTNANTAIMEVIMDYKSLQGSEAIFRVSELRLIQTNGQVRTYTLELPKQMIIDGDLKRLTVT
jgi:hypothetical protein